LARHQLAPVFPPQAERVLVPSKSAGRVWLFLLAFALRVKTVLAHAVSGLGIVLAIRKHGCGKPDTKPPLNARTTV